MQQIILALALFFTSLLFSQSQGILEKKSGATITIDVVNALNDIGEVKFGLYTKENFRIQPLYSKSSHIENGRSSVVFENVPSGIYAVVCFHDENKNDRLDFYENGMPKESFGSSNNTWSFGPPQFENSKFEVTNNDLTLEIKF